MFLSPMRLICEAATISHRHVHARTTNFRSSIAVRWAAGCTGYRLVVRARHC